MRKFLVLFLFTFNFVQAQQIASSRLEEVAYVDTKAPIGLDLMYGKKEGITVFPNSSNDRILISVAGKLSENKSFVIYNFSGKAVFKSGTRRENTYLVDVSGLRKDLYIVEVNSGAKTYRKKWMRN